MHSERLFGLRAFVGYSRMTQWLDWGETGVVRDVRPADGRASGVSGHFDHCRMKSCSYDGASAADTRTRWVRVSDVNCKAEVLTGG